MQNTGTRGLRVTASCARDMNWCEGDRLAKILSPLAITPACHLHPTPATPVETPFNTNLIINPTRNISLATSIINSDYQLGCDYLVPYHFNTLNYNGKSLVR
jgi:hypothetical protein